MKLKVVLAFLLVSSFGLAQSRSIDATSTSNKLTAAASTAAIITGSQMTASGWFRVSANGTNSGFCYLCVTDFSTRQEYIIRVNNPATCTSSTNLIANNSNHACDGTTNSTNTWTWFGLTLDTSAGGTQTAWRNDALEVAFAGGAGTIASTSDPLLIGDAPGSTTAFTILVGQVAEWDLAMPDPAGVINTNVLMRALARGVPPNCVFPGAHLKAYWPILGHASPEPDSSLNRNSLTVGGSAPAGASSPPMMPCYGSQGTQAY
jgi:hypothetical protein